MAGAEISTLAISNPKEDFVVAFFPCTGGKWSKPSIQISQKGNS
jgi:hypothetical protein